MSGFGRKYPGREKMRNLNIPVGMILSNWAIRAAGRCDVDGRVDEKAGEHVGGTSREKNLYCLFIKPGNEQTVGCSGRWDAIPLQ
jgi:hypothetical protein